MTKHTDTPSGKKIYLYKEKNRESKMKIYLKYVILSYLMIKVLCNKIILI